MCEGRNGKRRERKGGEKKAGGTLPPAVPLTQLRKEVQLFPGKKRRPEKG